jgi:hypothetical protein
MKDATIGGKQSLWLKLENLSSAGIQLIIGVVSHTTRVFL